MTDFNFYLDDIKDRFAEKVSAVLNESGYQSGDVAKVDFYLPVVAFDVMTCEYKLVHLQVHGIKVDDCTVSVLGTDQSGYDMEMYAHNLSVDNLYEVLNAACSVDNKDKR